jgi:hypothetical protein
MTDTTAPATTPDGESAGKPTIELVKDRRVFADLETAGAALASIAQDSNDFASVKLLCPGATFTEEGEFVPEAPEWTAETHEIMLAPLTTKAVKDKAGKVTKPASLTGLVLCPIPTAAAVFADDTHRNALLEVWQKEMNHRAVRKLRNAENPETAVAEMPLSLESFCTSQAGGGVSAIAAFDDHWLPFSQAMAQKVPQWAARFPGGKGKAHIRAAIENAAKAAALYPELESYGKSGESLFARILKAIIAKATREGQDTALLAKWLETRDQMEYDATTEATLDNEALDDLFADFAPEAEGDESESDTDADSDEDEGDAPDA